MKCVYFEMNKQLLYMNESLMDDIDVEEVKDDDYNHLSEKELLDFSKYTYVFSIQINEINQSQAVDSYNKNMDRFVKFTNILKDEFDYFLDFVEYSEIVYYMPDRIAEMNRRYNGNKKPDMSIIVNDKKSMHYYKDLNVYSTYDDFYGYKCGDKDSDYIMKNKKKGFAYEPIIRLQFGVVKLYPFGNIPEVFRFFCRIFDMFDRSLKKVWPKSNMNMFYEKNLSMMFYYVDIKNFKNREFPIINKLVPIFRQISGKNLKNNLIAYMSHCQGKKVNKNLIDIFKKLKIENRIFDFNIDYENHQFVINYSNSNNNNCSYVYSLPELKSIVEKYMYKETGEHGYTLKFNNFTDLDIYVDSIQDIEDIKKIFGTEFTYVSFYIKNYAFLYNLIINKKVIKTGLAVQNNMFIYGCVDYKDLDKRKFLEKAEKNNDCVLFEYFSRNENRIKMANFYTYRS